MRGAKGIFEARVLANRQVCREHYRLVLEARGFPHAEPGQFVQLLCHDSAVPLGRADTFVRRPFSLGGLIEQSGSSHLVILHRAIGPGTRWLARLGEGQQVSVLGPLGGAFSIPQNRSTAWLVAGGIGLPPLIWFAEALRRAGQTVVAFCGARSADLLPLTRRAGTAVKGCEPGLGFEEFAAHGVPVVVATDDGSLGYPGVVSSAFQEYADAHANEHARVTVYTCGPEVMMRAVAGMAEARDLPCQVCLERVMACGMGTCQSCVVRIRDSEDHEGWRYRLCCTDGPVFDSRRVIWQDGVHA